PGRKQAARGGARRASSGQHVQVVKPLAKNNPKARKLRPRLAPARGGCARTPACGGARGAQQKSPGAWLTRAARRSFGEYAFLEDSRYASQVESAARRNHPPCEPRPFLNEDQSRRRASSGSMIGMPARIGYASLAEREISSCFSASYSSGPLVSGQTRISRSLGSTLPAGRSGEVVMINSKLHAAGGESLAP